MANLGVCTHTRLHSHDLIASTFLFGSLFPHLLTSAFLIVFSANHCFYSIFVQDSGFPHCHSLFRAQLGWQFTLAGRNPRTPVLFSVCYAWSYAQAWSLSLLGLGGHCKWSLAKRVSLHVYSAAQVWHSSRFVIFNWCFPLSCFSLLFVWSLFSVLV